MHSSRASQTSECPSKAFDQGYRARAAKTPQFASDISAEFPSGDSAAWIVSSSTFSSSAKLDALSTSEYGNTPIQSNSAACTKPHNRGSPHRFAGKADDERSAQRHAGIVLRMRRATEGTRRRLSRASFEPGRCGSRAAAACPCISQRAVCGDGIQQPLRHAVRIAVQGSHPLQAFDARQPFEQQGQAVTKSKVFPVRSSVLADQRDFTDPSAGQAFRLRAPPTQIAGCGIFLAVADDAERARMIAAFGDFDVRGRAAASRGSAASGRGRGMREGLPRLPCRSHCPSTAARMFRFRQCPQPRPLRGSVRGFVAVALHQASGHDQFFRRAKLLIFGHLQNRIDRSFCAGAMKLHVLTTSTSASSARGVNSYP